MQPGKKSSIVKWMSSSKKTDDESVVLDIADVAEDGPRMEDSTTILEPPTLELPAVTRDPSDALSHETNASEWMDSLSVSCHDPKITFEKLIARGCKGEEAEEAVASAGGTTNLSPDSLGNKPCNDQSGSADGAVAFSSRRPMNSSMDGKELSMADSAADTFDCADTLMARLRGIYSRKPLQCLLFGIMVRQCCHCLPPPSPSISTFLPLPVSSSAPSVPPPCHLVSLSPSFSFPRPVLKSPSAQKLDALVPRTKTCNSLLLSCARAAALLFGTGGGLGELGICPSREAC
jgi:hypothetical protein